MFFCWFFFFLFYFLFFFFFCCLYNSICCGYLFELHRQVDAIQMGTHIICLYKEVDKNYTGYNLKTMELNYCVLIGVCVVIRSNMVKYEPAHEKRVLIT